VSEANIYAELTANIEAFQRTLGERLLPAIEEAATAIRKWYNAWPGMPYTAPSLWDASQMATDR
jgi:hypothetical protein